MSLGAFAGGLAAGIATGEDPRRGTRRLVALFVSLVALLGLVVAVAMQLATQNGSFLPGWVFFTLFWGFTLAASTMKWVTFTPVSAFSILPRAILAARQTTSGKVWAIGAGAAWVLAIITGATRATTPTIFITLVLVVFAWGMGISAGKAEARVMVWMEEVRSAVARAIPCDPGQLEGGNSGDLRRPEVTLMFPWVLYGEAGLRFLKDFSELTRGARWHILGMDGTGITICLDKDKEHHQNRKR